MKTFLMRGALLTLALLMFAQADLVEAKSVTCTSGVCMPSIPGTLWGIPSVIEGGATSLSGGIATVSYAADIIDNSTGLKIPASSTILVGTTFKVIPESHERSDISWFMSGYWDSSPFGYWTDQGQLDWPGKPLTIRFSNWVGNPQYQYSSVILLSGKLSDYGLSESDLSNLQPGQFGEPGEYGALEAGLENFLAAQQVLAFGSRDPVEAMILFESSDPDRLIVDARYLRFYVTKPTITYSVTGPVSCIGNTCTIIGVGDISVSAVFQPTTGRFMLPGDKMYNAVKGPLGVYDHTYEVGMFSLKTSRMTSTNPNPVDYTLNVPQQTITWNLTAVASNTAPTTPSITPQPFSGDVNTAYPWTAVSTDPDGDQLSYQFDWDNNSSPDQTTPMVNSGTSQSLNNPSGQWSIPGTYNFKVRAVDNKGGVSGWTTAQVTVVAPIYSCTGLPTNATICFADDSGLSGNTPSTVVSSCGPALCEFTCNSGYIQSGNSCVRTQCNDTVDNDSDGKIDAVDPGCDDINDNDETDPLPPTPTATINVAGCKIPDGGTSCTVAVDWTSTGATLPSVRRDGVQISMSPSNPNYPDALTPGTYTYAFFDSGVPVGSSKQAIVECQLGSFWTGTQCSSAVTVMLYSMICDNPAELPPSNPVVDSNTASQWVATHPSCHMAAGWYFERWPNPPFPYPGDDPIGPTGAPRILLGPTNNQGYYRLDTNSTDLSNIPWFRVVNKAGYTTFGSGGSRFYCNDDGGYSDNIETPTYNGIVTGNAYYCISWKSPLAMNLPDLISQSLVVPPLEGGVPVEITAVVRNDSVTDTANGFRDTFESSTVSSSGPWNQFGSIDNTVLTAGDSKVDVATFIPGEQPVWIRHCVDRNNDVAEINDADNCTVNGPFAPPAVSIFVDTCTITTPGVDECIGSTQWTFSNASPNYLVKSATTNDPLGTDVSQVAPGVSTRLKLGSNLIEGYHNNGTLLGSQNVTIKCGGTVQESTITSRCETPPSISIDADPKLIRSGNTTTVTIATTSVSPLTCDIYGAESTPRLGESLDSSTPITIDPTKPIKNKQIISVTCTDTTTTGLSTTKEIAVEVVPAIEEV